MFERLSDRTSSIVFIVLTLGISLGTANVAGGIILAFSPVLVTLVMLLVVTREGYSRNGWGRLGMGRLGLRIWPFTVAATAGVSVLATAGTVAFGFARFTAPHDDWAKSALILCVTGPILAFAEEIGWRGYLQPRLAFLGERRAMLVIGVVWIAWHLPYILLTPYYHSDGDMALVLPLFGASVIAFSFLIGYLRVMAGSVWPAVLAHFAHNATFAWLLNHAISTKHPVIFSEYLAGDTGLFVFIGTAAFALVAGVRYSAAASRRPAHASGR
ncbi:CPBP family intramembrane metalloprotease [Streptomyces bathyalis]|uniref:CPBP family intramembrane metalloprotease n=1 Tax=Streptomyces bathyalis TaxID=2710756 RepID=A0A7T1WU30_9ACTN|nr:CPBP family intramembrane glutamic endopeptidase [Streptomyces bathyalis]QPP08757.1 CPBP family intramembrane metalloprotease [Streptomyces bathyalis]